MNEQQKYLFFFRKFTFCRHKYSCFEHVLRTVYKTIGVYLIIKVGIKLLFKDAEFDMFAKGLKKILGEDISDKKVADAALFTEVNAFLSLNVYLLRKCFYSGFLEFLAD